MAQHSAGILLYRRTDSGPEVLLVHPGGPFWARKDSGAWSIPKGLCEPNEDPEICARREFAEETGAMVDGDLVGLGDFKQPGGKVVTAFACEGDFDPAALRSNLVSMEWPPRSGRMQEFPEADRAAWFSIGEAGARILKGQAPMLPVLLRHLAVGNGAS